MQDKSRPTYQNLVIHSSVSIAVSSRLSSSCGAFGICSSKVICHLGIELFSCLLGRATILCLSTTSTSGLSACCTGTLGDSCGFRQGFWLAALDMLEIFKHSQEVDLRDTVTKTLRRWDGSSTSSIEDNIDLSSIH